jgi:hypothetical protein
MSFSGARGNASQVHQSLLSIMDTAHRRKVHAVRHRLMQCGMNYKHDDMYSIDTIRKTASALRAGSRGTAMFSREQLIEIKNHSLKTA